MQQRVDTATYFIQPTQGGDRALPRLAVLVAERLDELQVAVPAGARELEVRIATLSQYLPARYKRTIATTINPKRRS